MLREQVTEVLVDLKSRICGDFYITSENEDKVGFGNRVCRFEDKVKDRPCMCVMSSNVFGSITANALDNAKVEPQKKIARGDKECKVVDKAKTAQGRQYFGEEYSS